MVKYAQVVFCEFQDPESMNFSEFYELSDREKVDYLSRLDYGEYHDLRSESTAGKADTVKRIDDYILSYNWNLEYAGLQRIIER